MYQPAANSPTIRITFLAVIVLAAGMWSVAAAQATQTRPTPQPTPAFDRSDRVDFGSREFDARTRLILKAEKKAHQEHVDRAKEARELAAELQKTYEAARSFNAADYKKLERLEKLTRRIRNDIGGSQTNADPKELPITIDEAVNVMAKMTKDLSEEVEQTPRRVVSASIIDQANKLVALIQYLRGTRD